LALARAVVFDLDDTLYLERDYVMSGFQAVAQMVSATVGITEQSVRTSLARLFYNGTRGNTFDLLVAEYPELSKHFSVVDLVTAYRSHVPNISMICGADQLLRTLQDSGVKIALITDGFHSAQRLKFESLGLSKLVEVAVFTDVWGKHYWKPHPRSFCLLMDLWSFEPEEFVYVADNPEKDFIAPNALGWQTIRIRTRGQLHFGKDSANDEHAAKAEVASLEQLDLVLA